jgi:hypothetical protein
MNDVALRGNANRARTVQTAIQARMHTIRCRNLDAEHHDDVLFVLDALDELAVIIENVANACGVVSPDKTASSVSRVNADAKRDGVAPSLEVGEPQPSSGDTPTTPDEQRAASEAPVANDESNGTCAQCRTAILITDYVCGRGDREIHYRCWRAAVEAKLSPPGPPPSPLCALCKRDPLACSCKARSRRAAVARLAATPLGPTRSGRQDKSE